MNMETSKLTFAVKTNKLGQRESLTCEWEGKSPYIYIAIPVIMDELNVNWNEIPKEVQLGPYKLLEVSREPQYDSILYVRKDKFGKLRVALYKSTRWMDLIYRRLLLTLVVWNLANYSMNSIPSWRDIKFFKGK